MCLYIVFVVEDKFVFFLGQTQSSDVYEFSNEPNWDEVGPC